jgi:hypothetical protein
MSNDVLGSMPKGESDRDAAWNAVYRLDAARRTIQEAVGERAPIEHATADQLARDIAEIERATAALRKAEPALEAWTGTERPSGQARKPRSVWFLVGALWLSTAIVTAGALVAIASLVG